jgi:hypothetical protein
LAERTLPKKTSSTSLRFRPERSTAALMTWAPSWVAVRDEREPMKEPIGVRATPTM